ncbi:MAG TPA: response regulator [Gammaproteobacteria bacterium]
MPGPLRVLVVDDDADVRELIRDYLSDQGYDVIDADGAAAARALLGANPPHIALLDVGLPGEDGLSLARHIREHYDIGIIMVSGAGETVDRIIGLEVGADDYVSKPFDPRELRARLKSVLRRYQRGDGNGDGESAPAQRVAESASAATRRVNVGACLLDLDTRQLFTAQGEETPLTSMEFELLKVFVERPNRPLSRDQLLTLTQNRDWDPFDRSIDIRIARLRRKIETDPEQPQVIRTLRGVGYMFVPAPR